MIARDELAARVLVALLTRDGYDGAGAARDAVAATDALLSILRPEPGVKRERAGCHGEDSTLPVDSRPAAPVPPASDTATGGGTPLTVLDAKATRVPPASSTPPALEPRRTVGAVVKDSLDAKWIVTAPGMARVLNAADAGDVVMSSHWRFIRWATRAECERHGVPFVDRTPPAAALTEEERADLRDAIWKERTAWLATGADQRSEPDVYANAAAAWFAKRDGTVKP